MAFSATLFLYLLARKIESSYQHQKYFIMNLKRIFGALLTVLGIAGLIFAAVEFVNSTTDVKPSIIFGILGLLFFISGISLVRTTKDES